MLDKKEYYKKYYEKNKEKYIEYIKKYQQSEKGQKKIREYKKKYHKTLEFKKWRRDYAKKRHTPQYNLYIKINNQIKRCLLRSFENKETILLPSTQEAYMLMYGIDLIEIVDHLKPLPKNFKGLELDHIIPISKFDLKNRNDIKKAYAKENLQLLLPVENRRKGNS